MENLIFIFVAWMTVSSLAEATPYKCIVGAGRPKPLITMNLNETAVSLTFSKQLQGRHLNDLAGMSGVVLPFQKIRSYNGRMEFQEEVLVDKIRLDYQVVTITMDPADLNQASLEANLTVTNKAGRSMQFDQTNYTLKCSR